MKYCRSCGRRFDAGELSSAQIRYYSETICKKCWSERSQFYELNDTGGKLRLYWKEGVS